MSRAINFDDRSLMYESLAGKLSNWRAARAQSVLGIAKSNILAIGDSTTCGVTESNTNIGMRSRSYATRTAELLTSAMPGLKVGSQNAFGDSGFGGNAPVYDPRVTLGSWTFATPGSFAGQCFRATEATATPMSFTPTVDTDRCEIYYLTNPSLGSFNANINGGADTLQSTTVAQGVGKMTLSGTLGANTYNITHNAGTVFVIGFNAYASADTEVSFLNMGRGGGEASEAAGAWGGAAVHMLPFAPRLLILQFGINEWLSGTAVSTYNSSLTSLAEGRPSDCDLIMLAPIQSDSNSAEYETVQRPFTDAFAALAAELGAVYIDQNARTGGFASADALGFMAGDGVHGSASMYLDEAMALRDLMLSV